MVSLINLNYASWSTSASDRLVSLLLGHLLTQIKLLNVWGIITMIVALLAFDTLLHVERRGGSLHEHLLVECA